MESASEFDLIRAFFDWPAAADNTIRIPVGDDCSVITSPAGMSLAQSIDTQVADVHFPKFAPAHLIASRALRCAVSDLAAMGAIAHSFHLALTLPEASNDWLASFSQGLRKTASELDIQLIGGDTTRGKELVISIAVQGWLPSQQGLTRSGAGVDEDIWVTGLVGESAMILPSIIAQPQLDGPETQPYYHPEVHLKFAQALLPFASSAMDISDGLMQDAAHIAKASQVALCIQAGRIPTPVAYGAKSSDNALWEQCVTGGDDYQLLFTAPKSQRETIQTLAREHNLPNCQVIGETKSGSTVSILEPNGQQRLFKQTGYTHF